VGENIEVSTTSYTPLTSLAQAVYYWRVQAVDASLNSSNESTARSFTIKLLNLPANNAVIFTTTGSAAPVLSWIAVTGASSYTVKIDDDNNFDDNNFVREQNVNLLTSYTVAPALAPGVYYWRVVPTGFSPARR
jgi:hypothetical protein